MRKKGKRIVCIALSSALITSSFAGCSKKTNVRKIEGASDDTAKLVGVIEEIYDMKGYKVDTTLTANDYNFKISTIVDSNNNYQMSISAKAKINDSFTIDGDIATISLIGNDIYLDLTKGFETIKPVVGQAILTQAENSLKEIYPDFSFEKLLVSKLSLGDIDRSAISTSGVKTLAQKITDIFAVALTKSETLKVDDKTYSVNIDNADSAVKFSSALIDLIVENKEAVFDEFIKYIDTLKLPDNSKIIVDEMLSTIKKSLSDNISEEMSAEIIAGLDALDTSEITSSIKNSIDDLKNDKSTLLGRITSDNKDKYLDNVKNSFDGNFSVSVTDTKEGYNVSLKTDTINTGETAYNVSEEMSVVEYTDTIKAPEVAADGGGTIAILIGVLAPQYLKYVEKSKISTDRYLEENVKASIQTVLCDEAVYSSLTDTEFILYFDGTTITSDSENVSAVIDEAYNIIGKENKWSSATYKNLTLEFKISFDNSYGWSVECSNSPFY